MTNASQLSITQLASTINAHTGKAEHYADKAEQHYKAAGLHLIEAKKRIAAGEYEGGFVKFLKDECKALSSSRAYELIAIANGTKTVGAYRKETAARVKRSRMAAVRYVAESSNADAINPTDHEVLKREKASWRKILAVDKEHERGQWRDVGMGLCAGWEAHPNSRDFDAWRVQFGFSDISPKVCNDLMFSAEHADMLDRLRDGLNDPTMAAAAFVEAVNAAFDIALFEVEEKSAMPARKRTA